MKPGIDPQQFRDLVVRPVLRDMRMWSLAAERLVLGTVAAESEMGYSLKQRGGGPAVGVCQMEPTTAKDLLKRYLSGRRDIDRRFQAAFQLLTDEYINWALVPLARISEKIMSDLRFAVGLCRLRYWVVPEHLPEPHDVEALALYWKRHYNTALGAGRTEDFETKFTKYGIGTLVG